MTTRRIGWMVVIGAAIVLLGAGVAFAKSHGDHGSSKHGSPGHGGTHGHGKKGGDGSDDGAGDAGAPGHGKGNKHGGKGSCDPAAASVIGAFVDSTCPCAGLDDGAGGTIAWKNHGQYVRCVAHAVKDAARAAGVKRRCARDLVPCAARSTCGKRNAVTCIVGTVGTCTGGACSAPPATPCTTDADCVTPTCGVTSAAQCTELGGTAGSGSCCTASPSGAFVD